MSKSYFSNLDSFFRDELNNGIFVKYADIVFGKTFIYAITPQNVVIPCVIYLSKLSSSEYKKGVRPILHFCNCNKLWSMYDKDSTMLKAQTPAKNLFDYSVKQNRVDVKLFYNMELPMCSECVSIYEKVFLKFIPPTNMYFWKLLFSNNNVLKTEQIAIEDAIAVSNDFSNMSVKICDDCFILEYKKDGLCSL